MVAGELQAAPVPLSAGGAVPSGPPTAAGSGRSGRLSRRPSPLPGDDGPPDNPSPLHWMSSVPCAELPTQAAAALLDLSATRRGLSALWLLWPLSVVFYIPSLVSYSLV